MTHTNIKFVATILLASIIAGGVFIVPRKASAQIFGTGLLPVWCVPWLDFNCLKEAILDPLATSLAKSVIRQLRAATINWIITGDFDLKKPFFITSFVLDPQKIAENVSRQFLSDLTGINFCNFHPRLQSAPSLNININFNKQFACTFGNNGSSADYEAFLRDFDNGGWPAFFGLQQAKNDPIQTLLSSIDQKEKNISRATAAYIREAALGGGFLGQRDPKTGKIKTPGRLIADTLQNAQLSEYIGQELVNEIFGAITEIIDTAIGKTIEDGLLKNF
ncbi:MAG: hypothetical protein Q7R73_04260 [bacterium]|nr:hypothetical protein [bacterium]